VYSSLNAHWDIMHVWKSLYETGGVQYVHASRYYGPSFIKASQFVPGFVRPVEQLTQLFKQAINPHLEEASKVHAFYMKMKEDIKDNANLGKTESYSVTDDIAADFMNKLEKATIPLATHTVEIERAASPSSDIGAKRRRLKNRAMFAKEKEKI
jgi:hypothetical protein